MSTDGQEKRDARLTAALDGLHGGDGVQRGLKGAADRSPASHVRWQKGSLGLAQSRARCVIELRRNGM